MVASDAAESSRRRVARHELHGRDRGGRVRRVLATHRAGSRTGAVDTAPTRPSCETTRCSFGGLRLEDLTPERVQQWAAAEIDPCRPALELHAREGHHRLPRCDGARWQRCIGFRSTLSATSRSRARGTSCHLFPGGVDATAAGRALALRWRDVDFGGSAIRVRASYTNGHLTTPKPGTVRSVPMAAEVAEALARLGRRQHFVGEDDLVFAGVGAATSTGPPSREALPRGAVINGRIAALNESAGSRQGQMQRAMRHLT